MIVYKRGLCFLFHAALSLFMVASAFASEAPSPWMILSPPRTTDPKLFAEFLVHHNPNLNKTWAAYLGRVYWEEAQREAVSPDIAFVQMCLETGFLRYGGQVRPEQNNFCGLGALDSGVSGAAFSSVRAGVRAHIQHLKAYATTEPLRGRALDPRYHLVEKGSAPTIDKLAGRWATDPNYGTKIKNLLLRLYRFKWENS